MRMILPALLLCTGVAASAQQTPAAPVVVELFQSQGCSSCPPADAVLNALAARPDVIALNFAVTYWDRLGWKDTFAKPAFTARQWEYARAAGRGNVATPQMIVDGRAAIVGSRPAEVNATIARARGVSNGPAITVGGRTVTIGAGRSPAPATLWLVAYDPRTIAVPISAGENGGRTIPHRNIVRQLTMIGTWRGRAARFDLPPARPGIDQAVLLQAGPGGPILAARRI